MLVQHGLKNSSFIFLALVAILAQFDVQAILMGELISLERHGFLVKILARGGLDGPVKSCTGSLISSSLVLTSGQCVLDQANKENKLRNFVVLLRKPNQREFRSTAKFLEMKADESWALLRIPPQNITDLCPPNPAPKWVARLNFRPSLTSNPRLIVNAGITNLSNDGTSPWRLIGFTTTVKPDDFLREWTILRLFIDHLEEQSIDGGKQPKQWRGNVYDNYTACYDDGGAPLLFILPSMHTPNDPAQIHLGLFQSLSMPMPMTEITSKGGDKQRENSLINCQHANHMHFSLFHDDADLARAIERYALAEFLDIYQKCGFSGEAEAI